MKLTWLAFVICIGCGGGNDPLGLREEKTEYTQHAAALADRIEELATTATDSIDLATVDGLYGYNVHFDEIAGSAVGDGTLEVCVNSSGSTAINYFPHFAPGFDFLDTTPGCTEITNPDPTLDNDVLVELSGTGTATITTRLVP